MAAKSFTALPSVVSVYAEKTAVQMRCYSRGFEKVTWPIVAIIIDVVALACLAVAAGTPMWVEIRVRNGTDDRGSINFGLFNGAHRVRYRESPIADTISDSYLIFNQYTSFSLAQLQTTVALSIASMLLCLLIAPLLFLNSYQTVTTWWKGPPMLYIISFLTSALGLAAAGVFLDFYLWNLDLAQVFVDSTSLDDDGIAPSFRYLLDNEGYTLHKILHYSFGLHLGGAVFPLLVLLMMWRLTVLLPQKRSVSVDLMTSGLSAANLGVSNRQMQMENEEYAIALQQSPQPREAAPFDHNVILQTPVRSPEPPSPPPELEPEPDDQDIFY